MVERTVDKRMTTEVKRVFKQISADPLFQEVFLHYIYFLNHDGTLHSQKLDRTIPGGLYKLASPGDTGVYGFADYVFPDGITRRLVALNPTDY